MIHFISCITQVLITGSIVHYYASWMEPTSAAHILQESDELQKLTKDLAKCRADKEFVWGLWKKLQKTNPDLNAAIEMVVAREKSSHQQRLDQLLAYGQEKETHFDKLSEEAQELSSRLEEESEKLKLSQSENLQVCSELSALQSALSAANQRAARCEEMEKEHRSKETAQEVLQQQLSTQEMAFKSQVTEMSDNTRQLAAKNRSLSTRAMQAETRGREMQEKLNEFGEQLRAVRDECNQRVEASRSLDQLLSEKREELEQKGRDLELARRDKEDISRRLSECSAEGERHKLSVNETRSLCNRLQSNLKESEEQLTRANSLNQMLSNKVSEDAREIFNLKERMRERESSKMHRAQLQHNETYTQTYPQTQALDSTTVVLQLLESKSIETDQLRKSHDRRLQRYKELQATNKLLRDQLSTYAPDSIPAIQHQEAERVLNEMPVELVAAQSCDNYAEVSE